MVISGKHKYIFVAASKNASTTSEHILANTADILLTNPRFGKHDSLKQIKNRFSAFFDQYAAFDNYFSFGIIRDPVKRVISKFNYRSQFDSTHNQYCGNMSFEQFVEDMCSKNPSPGARIDSQAAFFGFDGSELGVDCLLRVEKLGEDSSILAGRLGFDFQAAIAGGKYQNKNDVIRVRREDIPDVLMDKIEAKVADDIALYNWVSEAYATNRWKNIQKNDSPAIQSEGVLSFFREHYPDHYFVSLRSHLRLSETLTDSERNRISAEVDQLRPEFRKRLAKSNKKLGRGKKKTGN